MTPQRGWSMWVIFRNPTGTGYVANRCEIRQGKREPVPTADFLAEPSIGALREHFRTRGFIVSPRMPGDQANLVEYWL